MAAIAPQVFQKKAFGVNAEWPTKGDFLASCGFHGIVRVRFCHAFFVPCPPQFIPNKSLTELRVLPVQFDGCIRPVWECEAKTQVREVRNK